MFETRTPMGAQPYRGPAALRDHSVCCTGSTSYPVLPLLAVAAGFSLSKVLMNEAGAERRVRVQ